MIGELSEREWRLRERIDELTEQRDEALAALWKARDTIDDLRRRAEKHRRRKYELANSVKFWRHRALTKTKGAR